MSYILRSTCYVLLPMLNVRFIISTFVLRTTYYVLRTTYYVLCTVYYVLVTTHYSPLATQSLTAHCLLLTTHSSAKFRTKARLPVLTWMHPNGAVLCRSSQPKVRMHMHMRMAMGMPMHPNGAVLCRSSQPRCVAPPHVHACVSLWTRVRPCSSVYYDDNVMMIM